MTYNVLNVKPCSINRIGAYFHRETQLLHGEQTSVHGNTKQALTWEFLRWSNPPTDDIFSHKHEDNSIYTEYLYTAVYRNIVMCPISSECFIQCRIVNNRVLGPTTIRWDQNSNDKFWLRV